MDELEKKYPKALMQEFENGKKVIKSVYEVQDTRA